jgi:dTMP kinase
LNRGKFITFEGIDGAGKSSHIAWFADELRARGHDVVLTREPGGTLLAEKLRQIILNDAMQPATEALLVFAARQEHVLQVIEPALARGEWVLCDRFTDATFAYQGYGRGFDLAKLAELEHWVQGLLQPGLTVVFECSPATAAARLAASRPADKFEREDIAFFTRVAEGYRARMRSEPSRFRAVNSEQPMDAVRAALHEVLQDCCAGEGAAA